MIDERTALKNAIDKRAPDIINLVNDFANQHFDVITRTRDGKRQFTELVEAAAQTCCINEFKLYIKYKGAKEGTRSLWGNLANPFNAKIDSLVETVADDIVKKDKTDDIVKKDKADETEKDNEAVRIEVLKRFCGYLMWRVHADISMRGGR